MKGVKFTSRGLALLLACAVLQPSSASAQDQAYTITCSSQHNQYTTCRLPRPGYVTLEVRESKSPCVQGRNWDYDRREIWVDDGCRAQFRVHPQDSEHLTRGEKAAVVGAALGAVILGAIAENRHHRDDHKYQDSNYHGSRHSSYVPDWMIGSFRGYNPQYGAEVTLTIEPDGRAMARLDDGRVVPGYVNDHLLHVGDASFDVDRTSDGFATHPDGEHHNVLRYRRLSGSGGSAGWDRYDARGEMRCSYGSPAYDRSCGWRVRRPGYGSAQIEVDMPGGRTRTLHFRDGEFESPGTRLQYWKDGDHWYVNVDDREFLMFAEALITGG